jgi:hypothetical protein
VRLDSLTLSDRSCNKPLSVAKVLSGSFLVHLIVFANQSPLNAAFELNDPAFVLI